MIVVSIIVGLNIISVIDRKISNVAVNIPPVKIPEQTFVLNIQEDTDGKITVCPSAKTRLTDITENRSKPVEETDPDKIERFIVSDAQEIHNYNKLTKATEKLSDNFDEVDVPADSDEVDYDNTPVDKKDFYMGLSYEDRRQRQPKKSEKLYIGHADFGWEAPRQVVSCGNSSISQKWKPGEKSLLPYKIQCNKPNKITAENYYKTHYKAMVVPIEDYTVRGWNYQDFSNTVHPGKIDFRILSQATKGINPNDDRYKNIPDGANYAFHNTPAMRMP